MHRFAPRLLLIGMKTSVVVSDGIFKTIDSTNQKKSFDSMAHIHESSYL